MFMALEPCFVALVPVLHHICFDVEDTLLSKNVDIHQSVFLRRTQEAQTCGLDFKFECEFEAELATTYYAPSYPNDHRHIASYKICIYIS